MKKLVLFNRQFPYTSALMLLVIGVLCSMFAGCKNDGLSSVSGKVTWNGTPLEEGTISFMPRGESGVSTAAQIKNGDYSARVSPGKMIVKIYAERPLTPDEATALQNNPMSGSSMTPSGVEVKKQYIPENYNDRSSLFVEIQGNQKNLDFQLESK